MPRPPKLRSVAHVPGAVYFKPRGIPMVDLEEVVLGLDELEALRLVDFEALSQEDMLGEVKPMLLPPFLEFRQSSLAWQAQKEIEAA